MMRWLFLILLLFCQQANAYTFECIPGVYGTQVGTVHTGKELNDGQWLLFFCKTDDGLLHIKSLYCSGAYCTGDLDTLARNIRTLTSATDIPRAIQTVAGLLTFDEPSCKDVAGGTSADRVCLAIENAMFANWPAGWILPARLPPRVPAPPIDPVPMSFVVAPTSICATQDKNALGICITRQSFSWDGSIRGPLAQPERATIGAPCDPTKGPAPYFVFDVSRPDRVVQCVKK